MYNSNPYKIFDLRLNFNRIENITNSDLGQLLQLLEQRPIIIILVKHRVPDVCLRPKPVVVRFPLSVGYRVLFREGFREI